MNATGAEPEKTARALVLQPLAAAELPEAVRKLLASPAPMRTMAAKGIAPLRPTELALAIYQLSFDAEAVVSQAARAGAGGLPDKVVAPALAEPLPGPVLHFFAQALLPERKEALEKVLYNRATLDETFVLLAGRLREPELEVIFQNETRLLRCPAILEVLYENPEARMSSINRAIELCVRHGVRVEGIPAFDEVAKAIKDDPDSITASADAAFGGLLSVELEGETSEIAAGTEPAAADSTPEATAAKDGKAEGKSKRKSPIIDFSRLKLYEKIRLATLGNAYCRQNLMRDPNRMVAMAAIRSPRITDSEIVAASGNKGMSEDVIRYIASQRDLTKTYQVKLNLVQNPKCPVALSLKFLPLLHTDDIKKIARSKNVPGALATGARRLMAARAAKN